LEAVGWATERAFSLKNAALTITNDSLVGPKVGVTPEK